MGLVAGKAGGAAEHRKRQGLSQPRQKESMGSRSHRNQEMAAARSTPGVAQCASCAMGLGTVIERSIAEIEAGWWAKRPRSTRQLGDMST